MARVEVNLRRLLFLTVLLVLSATARAHNAPVDEIGCHTDPSTSVYHCLTGPLAGLEFISKEEAQEALTKKSNEPTTETQYASSSRRDDSGSERLNLVSWRLKKAPSKIDFDRIASILATSDIAILQGVEFNDHGDTSLMVIASVLERRLNEKICKGWFKTAKGERGQYGFIWRERVVGYVDTNGELRDSCSGHPLVIRSEVKETGIATFFLKSTHKLFVLSSVAFDKAPKRPEKDLPALFKGYADTGWAVVVAGDLRTNSKHAAFKDVRKWNFKPALNAPIKSKRGGNDNFWFKNISLISAAPMNLYEQFPEMAAKDVDANVGDSFPVRAEFSFSEKEADAVQTQMISKKKGKGPASTKGPVIAKIPVYAAPLSPGQLSDLKEDLESEESSIDKPGLKAGAKKKSSKKKKTK